MKPGDKCTVNNYGGIDLNGPCHEFIGQRCTLVKRNVAGMFEVRLDADPKRTMAFHARNLDLLPDGT
jgi:hypothetical protein